MCTNTKNFDIPTCVCSKVAKRVVPTPHNLSDLNDTDHQELNVPSAQGLTTEESSRTQLAKEEKALQMVEGKKNVSTTIPPTIPKDVPASPTIIEELSTDEDLPALLSEERETQLPLKKRRTVKDGITPIIEKPPEIISPCHDNGGLYSICTTTAITS
ncbi:Hypothetical predicted protein [Mytilus galloprovincialis]|uniref:Uncharacterized protein n=1 Tax=Mytilus galloprovincialis TaxID=29158 RepID=A0A8B6EAC7_MYTGA|nr:Hypothetical predicted protein [Mytilus galloprovincialis]